MGTRISYITSENENITGNSIDDLTCNNFLSLMNGKVGIYTKWRDFLTKDKKLKLMRLKEMLEPEKINLFHVDMLILNEKIDLSKLVNNDYNDCIDLFTYTTNTDYGRIDLANFINSEKGKIDLFMLNGITDENGCVDFTKIFDSKNLYKINYNLIDIDRFLIQGHLVLSKIKVSENKGKIDLYNFTPCIFIGKIDQAKLRNSDCDDSIDIFKYTTNHFKGKIDISKFTNSISGKIDMFKFNGLIDCNGSLIFKKIINGRNNKKINYSIFNLDRFFNNGKLILSQIKKFNANENIDIFDFTPCISNGKIDQAKLCNSIFDLSIDLFKYTINHSDGKIDLAKFVNSEGEKIDAYKFSNLIDDEGELDLAKITDSSLGGKIDLDKINFK